MLPNKNGDRLTALSVARSGPLQLAGEASDGEVRYHVTQLMQLAFDRLQHLLTHVGRAVFANLVGAQFQLTHLDQHVVVPADRFQFLIAHFDEAHHTFSSVLRTPAGAKMPVETSSGIHPHSLILFAEGQF
jgi:hypothetical protein